MDFSNIGIVSLKHCYSVRCVLMRLFYFQQFNLKFLNKKSFQLTILFIVIEIMFSKSKRYKEF